MTKDEKHSIGVVKNNKRLLNVLLFVLITAFSSLYIFVTTCTFLVYQWFINLDYDNFKSYYEYDTNSLILFSILSAIILTTLLYRPLSSSAWVKKVFWDRLENEKGELEEKHEEVKFRLTEKRLFNFLARLILGAIIICLPVLMFNPTYLSTIILMVMFLLLFVCIYILG